MTQNARNLQDQVLQRICNNKTLLTSAQNQLFRDRFEIFRLTLKISLMKSEGINTNILVTAAFLVLNKSKPDANTMKITIIIIIILIIKTPQHWKTQNYSNIRNKCEKNPEFPEAFKICSLYLCNRPSGKIKSLPTVRIIKMCIAAKNKRRNSWETV